MPLSSQLRKATADVRGPFALIPGSSTLTGNSDSASKLCQCQHAIQAGAAYLKSLQQLTWPHWALLCRRLHCRSGVQLLQTLLQRQQRSRVIGNLKELQHACAKRMRRMCAAAACKECTTILQQWARHAAAWASLWATGPPTSQKDKYGDVLPGSIKCTPLLCSCLPASCCHPC